METTAELTEQAGDVTQPAELTFDEVDASYLVVASPTCQIS
ncbi:hypothetical protein [Nocardia asteroides]|nr:hypothetical protein [Nocardia asteroides]SFM47850.1 hypothetical protein SAMN05444423_10394 [Nocardia asteroides]VEG33559.1 Uncharacterised protein [Nocardia asteroides]